MALERSAIGWQQYISRALGCKPGQLTYQLEECIEKIEGLKPRTVNSAAELDALPMGSVVREICETDFFGVLLIPGTFEKFPNGLGWHVVAGHGSREVPLPVTVLFTPGDAG